MSHSVRCTLLFVLLVAGCSGEPPTTTASRVRADFAADLNADAGWAEPVDGVVHVNADRPFRIRFEVEADRAGGSLRLEARRNGGEWVDLLARDFPYPDELSTLPVSIVSPEAYAPGAATTDLLSGSTRAFAPGIGVGLSETAGPVPEGQSEWEWPVVIRRWADGAVMMAAGEQFEFRLTDAGGEALAGAGPVSLTLDVPARHLGGTYVETPGRLGPWQSGDGRLWFPMEPAETFHVLMMMVSDDGGLTWTEADGENRPLTDDLEGFATAYHGGRIYLLHQVSKRVMLHSFRTSGAGEGNAGWEIRDELVSEPAKPPVQAVTLEALSDGTLIAVYVAGNNLEIRVRAATGGWSAPKIITAPPGSILSGPQSTLTADDVVHLAWTETNGATGSVRHATLGPDGTPGDPRTVATDLAGTEADVGSIAPLAYLPESGRVTLIWRRSDGLLLERRVGPDGSLTPAAVVSARAVVQNAVDSDQVGADAIALGGRLHVIFIDAETRDLYHVASGAPGVWSDPAPVIESINGQWVRGRAVARSDGRLVYGFVYDAGSDGGSGMNRYGELEPAAGVF